MTSSDHKSGAGAGAASFPVPSSLQDLERAPYNLQPYPSDFEDDDEAARADSFDGLVRLLETGNRALAGGGLAMFDDAGEEGLDQWLDDDRVQALYTLVRKSASLAPATRMRLFSTLCQAVHSLCDVLSSFNGDQRGGEITQTDAVLAITSTQDQSAPASRDSLCCPTASQIMPQSFRDAFACHLYMLFSVMSSIESEAKVGRALGTTTRIPASRKTPSKKRRKATRQEKEQADELDQSAASRQDCARAMLAASRAMGRHRSALWRRGVPDEAVVSLPCRIAYQMIENSTNATRRRESSGDEALGMIAAAVDSSPSSLMGTAVAALVDLLHSSEHVAPLAAELCCMVNERPVNRLATELLREVGRLDANNASEAGGKASGIRNVAPFISELAERRPGIVAANIGVVLPHLNSEPYVLRSAIVTAIGHILLRADKDEEDGNGEGNHAKEGGTGEDDSLSHTDGDDRANGARSNQKTRDALLDVLTERSRDVSSYTRVAVLKTWANLTEKDSLPVDRVRLVTALAIDRLQDKTVMVRRSAMQLLTLLLENNPFMGSLDPAAYRAKISELEQYLQEHVPERLKAEMKVASLVQQDTNSDDECGDKEQIASHEQRNSAVMEAAMEAAEALDSAEDMSDEEIEYQSKLRALSFSRSALEFVDLFENANQAFKCMLLSNNTSDVTEALRFFVRARHFSLPCAVTGMKEALALMWSSEENIREEVLKGFVEVFIAVPGTSGEELLPDEQIACNLVQLVGRASVSELASIEEAIRSLVAKERIPPEVFHILWSWAEKSSGEARSAAVQTISMGAAADPSVVNSAGRLNLLLDSALGEHVEENRSWKTISAAACALQQIGRAQDSSQEGSAKQIVLELIIERLCTVARGEWCKDEDASDTKAWFCAAEQAIDAIFVISAEPERASEEILSGMQETTFGSDFDTSECSALRLSRFFFVLGHIALKLLVYTEAVSSGVCRARAAKTLSRQEAADKAKRTTSPRKTNDGATSEDEDGIEAELGVAAEAEAETEQRMLEISEKEIVGKGTLGLFVPLLVEVIANDGGKFSDDILMQSSTLALCKCMCVSSSFCEEYLPLLFTTLANDSTKDTTLRANTVVALGDLAFRYPNAVEPYTPRIYACLRSDSNRVRRHTLMVLTHLILNDMVKVKGQVCEIALCLEDKDARIRDMARLLFHELSKRSNNPIYNLIPDIISRLGQMQELMQIEKDTFRNIMAFLLSFIKRERQNDTIFEKIIQRFSTCDSITGKASFAYCLTQLKANERCIKCLIDQFKQYKDALFDEEVFRYFSSIVSKAKAFAKPEMKEIVEELEAKLRSENETGMENHRASSKAKKSKKRAVRRKKKSSRKVYDGETDEDESDSGSELGKENAGTSNMSSGPARRSRRLRSA